MTQFPKMPSGETDLVQWARTIQQILQERVILNSSDIMVQQTIHGVALRIRPQPGARGGTTSNDKPVWL